MTTSAHIPLSIPCLNGREAEYVADCMTTNWISSVGKYVERFEADFAQRVGQSGSAVAVVNGTAALHLALLVAGVGPGDDVIVPSLTFIASINAIAYTGAQPVFADSTETTLGLCPQAVAELIEDSYAPATDGWRQRQTGRRLAAIMPVHILGHACQMGDFQALSQQYGVELIEDAAEGVGCYLGDRHVGTFGRFGCFSFNGNKVLSTGGGGMVVCAREEDAKQVRHLSTQAKADERLYLHDAVGYNYRLSNVHAAIGVGQLEHLDSMLSRRADIHHIYTDAVTVGGGVSLFQPQPWCRSNYWLALALVAKGKRDSMLQNATERQIQARPFWGLSHRQPPYRSALRGPLPQAERLHACGVCLPCHPAMTDEQVGRVAGLLNDYC